MDQIRVCFTNLRQELENTKSLSKKQKDSLVKLVDTLEDNCKKMEFPSLPPKPPNESYIIVRPKVTQSGENTLKELESKVNPADAEASIKSSRYLKNGSVIIHSGNSDKLKNEITSKLGENYNIEVAKLKKPRMVIYGVDSKKDDSQLVSDLKAQNSFLNCSSGNVKVVHQRQMRNKKWITYLEVDGPTFKVLEEKKYVNLGWSSYKVFEDFNIMRCYKCKGYGHKTNECTHKRACNHCAGDHTGEDQDCPNISQNPKCANCLKNSKPADHKALSSECPILITRISIQKTRINYHD